MRRAVRNLMGRVVMAASCGLAVYLCMLAASCGGDPMAEEHAARPADPRRSTDFRGVRKPYHFNVGPDFVHPPDCDCGWIPGVGYQK